MRKTGAALALTVAALSSAPMAEAAVAPAGQPASVLTADSNNDDDGSNLGKWGLAGLAGLLGLAGLARAGKQEVHHRDHDDNPRH